MQLLNIIWGLHHWAIFYFSTKRNCDFCDRKRLKRDNSFRSWYERDRGHRYKGQSLCLDNLFVAALNPVHTPPDGNLNEDVSLWKRIKYFPCTLSRRNLKMQQLQIILDSSCVWGKLGQRNHMVMWRHHFRKELRFQNMIFCPHENEKPAGIFKFLRFEERFPKAPFSFRIWWK